MKQKQRIDSLQALRAIAFLGVFTYHTQTTMLGPWGVSVFFVLSGFVLIYAYYEKTLEVSPKGSLRFAISRVARLYPLHILMMLVALGIDFFECYLDGDPSGAYLMLLFEAILHVFLVQTLVPNYQIAGSLNGVAWFFATSFILYLFFPLILQRIQRYKSRKSVWVGLGVTILIQCVASILIDLANIPEEWGLEIWPTYINPFFRLTDFVIGGHLGLLFLERSDVKSNPVYATIAELGTIILLVITQNLFLHPILGNWYRMVGLFTPSTILLIFLMARKQGAISKLLTNRFTVWLGNISPYTFLIHQIVIRFVRVFELFVLKININDWLITAIDLVLTIICSVIYMRLDAWARAKISLRKQA